MTAKTNPERMLFTMPKTPEYLEIMDMLDKYRLLMGLGWHDFIMIGFASVIREDNEDIADLILDYVKTRRRPGRPKGQSVKANLQRMGVNPNDITSEYK